MPETNSKFIFYIPFTDDDIDLLKKYRCMKKKINNILFYEPSTHIYLSEETPDDAENFEIFLTNEDIKNLLDRNIITRQRETSVDKLMMKSVYDKIPEEELDDVDMKKAVTMAMTKVYVTDLIWSCNKEGREPSLQELRKANRSQAPLWQGIMY